MPAKQSVSDQRPWLASTRSQRSSSLKPCTSLVAQSDFISILSVDVIDDPILGRSLVALMLDEPLPKAIFYLIQRKDTTLTPMSSYMAQLFRRYCQ